MNKPLIKIYGERNTGTNYLQRLIEENLDVDILPGVVPLGVDLLQFVFPGKEWIKTLYTALSYPWNLGWKHTLVQTVDRLEKHQICSNNILFVTLTKNPYAWLLSLYNRPHHHPYYETCKPVFDQFLVRPWPTIGRENGPVYFANPMQMWNYKNASYIRLKKRFTTMNITYEQLVRSPQYMIEVIRTKAGVDWRRRSFVNIETSTKKDKRDFAFYQGYYLDEQWRDLLHSHSIDIINQYLDDEILAYFGYRKLTDPIS